MFNLKKIPKLLVDLLCAIILALSLTRLLPVSVYGFISSVLSVLVSCGKILTLNPTLFQRCSRPLNNSSLFRVHPWRQRPFGTQPSAIIWLLRQKGLSMSIGRGTSALVIGESPMRLVDQTFFQFAPERFTSVLVFLLPNFSILIVCRMFLYRVNLWK